MPAPVLGTPKGPIGAEEAPKKEIEHMRCYICNRVIDDPQYNSEHKDYDPCPTCLEIIRDLVQGYDEDSAFTYLDDDEVFYDGYIPLSLHSLPGWASNNYDIEKET